MQQLFSTITGQAVRFLSNKLRWLFLDRVFVTVSLVLALSLVLAACQPDAAAPPALPPPPKVSYTHTPTRAASAVPQSTTAPTSIPSTLPDPKTLQGVKVILWHPWNGGKADALQKMVDEFNQTNLWGITVETDGQGGIEALYENLQAEVNDNQDRPQIIVTESEQLATLQARYQNLVDLTPYVNDSSWGFTSAELQDFNPTYWNQDLMQSYRLGIPALRDAPILFYNKTWAKELGFASPPQTPSDFREQACAAGAANLKDTDKQKNGTGGWFVNTGGLTLLSWLTTFNDPGAFTGGDSSLIFDTPFNQGAYIYLRTLYDHGCAWTGRSATPYEYFATRRALFYSGTLEDIPIQQQSDQTNGSQDEWTVLPYPSKDGKPFVLGYGYSYAMLSGDAPHQMAAWLVLHWLSLARNQASLASAATQLPVSASALDEMKDFRYQNPKYDQALNIIPLIKPAPSFANWLLVRPILKDSGWQLFQPTMTLPDVSSILKELDDTVQSVLKQTG